MRKDQYTLIEQSVTLIEQSGLQFVMTVLLEYLQYFCDNHYLDFFSSHSRP